MRGHNNASGTSKVQLKNQNNTNINNNNNNDATITLPRSKDVTGLQDTIYLCNFRVSVDGEWLCLKELQDGTQNQNEGAPIEETKSNVANEKCNEKIIERDWVNFYCRCFFLFFLESFLLSFFFVQVKKKLKQSMGY
jgi:hypothetical protein